MKQTLFLLLLITSTFSAAFCQADTSQATLHPDANTTYLDETGAKIDAMKFVKTIGGGGYTMQPLVESGHIKSLRLKKVGNKLSTGSMALDFSVKDMDGHLFSLKALRGKMVVLNFWFVNCPGCVKEMPALDSLADRYKNDPVIVFLAVTFDEKEKVRAFLKKHKFSYHVAAGQAALVQQYGIQAFPFSLVIDKLGHIAFSDNSGMEDVAGRLGSVIEAIRN